MNFQRCFVLPVFLLSCVGLFAQNDRSWMDLYEPHADEEMPYRLMNPLDYDSSKRYPVIVSLHGGGGTGSDNLKQLKVWNQHLADEQRRQDFPCYVLAPQADICGMGCTSKSSKQSSQSYRRWTWPGFMLWGIQWEGTG